MLKKSLPFVVSTAVIVGCVGLGANAAYGHGWQQEEAAKHTTVLWEYTGYPDLKQPQPFVDSVRGADIHAFDNYVKQPGMCGKTFQVDVYKTVVDGKNVSTLWSTGSLLYAHDGGFLAYGLGYTPYKVLTGKDTECQITTPPVTPEPTPTGTPTSPPTGEPTTPPVTESTEPTEPPEPTSTPTPGSTGSATPTSVPSTEPPVSPTHSASTPATTIPTGTSSPTHSGSTKTGSGTTPKTHSTEGTARTLAYTGINAVGPLIAAGVLLALGGITLWVRKRRKDV